MFSFLRKISLSFLRRKFLISRIYYIILVSCILVFFFNIFTLPLKIAVNKDMNNFNLLIIILSELLLTWILVMIVLFIFSITKISLKTFTAFLFLVAGSLSYYVLFNKIFIEEIFIASIFETPIRDAGKAFNLLSILWFIFLSIIPTIFILYNLKIKKYHSNILKAFPKLLKELHIIVYLNILVFILSFAINPTMYTSSGYVLKNSLANYMPSNYVAGLYQYIARVKKASNIPLIKTSQKYPFTWENQTIKETPLNIILVIGESARGDRQSLNGYKRETNPLLSKENNLISFPNMYACNTYTIWSIHCLLSYKTQSEFKLEIKETHLISIFQYLGFDTYFLSTHSMHNSLSYKFFMREGANKYVFNNNVRANIPSGSDVYDEYLLPFIFDVKDTSNSKHKLIVVQLIGSHTPYEIRYPEEFNKFGEKDNNSYDNTILYTDYILSKIINYYKDENTFLLYTSDHGESLGENGLSLHGAQIDIAPKEQIHIPLFIWASNYMIDILGDKYNNIKVKKDLRVSHDNIFHSLFHCLDINSSIIQKDLSLCN